MKPEIIFPEHFQQESEIIRSKGWVGGILVNHGNKSLELEIYDKIRFRQTIEDELEHESIFLLNNIIVLEEISENNIRSAIMKLIHSGQI